MREVRRPYTAVFAVAFLVASMAGLGSPPAASAQAPQPSDWASACSSGKLGLDKDNVAWAPVLAGDTTPSGKPVERKPSATGAWYPVVLVHGWTSQDSIANPKDRSGAFSHRIDMTDIVGTKVDVTRSLLGQLQSLPGAAVFTFDYHPYSARWIDDSHLGPGLGKVIDCLYQHSKQKVIVVGHSMGGLITRWAATHSGVTGADRSGEISSAVTFGTPETGSVAALLGEGVADVSAAASEPLAVLRVILAACGTLTSDEIETGTVCDSLPAFARAFESRAGSALRRGSPQLVALKPWPSGIYLDALAGNTSFEMPGAGWFGLPWSTKKVSGTGDMIVTPDSATYGAKATTVSSCDFQLNAVRGATDRIGLHLGLVAHSDVASQPLGSFTGPCFHSSLMRNIKLTNEALGAVADDLASRSAPTYQELLSAPVPDCGHKGGVLTNGIQLGIPVNHGDTALAYKDRGSRSDLTAFGDFNGDGKPDAATLLDCNAGGVSWPQMLVLYTHKAGGGLTLIAHAYLSDFNAPGHTAGENATARLLRTDGHSLYVEFSTQNEGDAAAWSNLDNIATITAMNGNLKATSVSAFTEMPTITSFLADLLRGDTTTAGRLAAPDVASGTASILAGDLSAYRTTPTCRGLNDFFLKGPVSVGQLVDPGAATEVGADTTDRVCYISPAAGAFVAFGMHHTGFRQWQVAWVRQVFG